MALETTFGDLHRQVKLEGRVALHRVGDVAVQVERDPNRCMA